MPFLSLTAQMLQAAMFRVSHHIEAVNKMELAAAAAL